MYGGQSAAAGTLLFLRGTAAVGALGAGENAAGGEDQDVAVGELLLEFAGEALLDLVEAWEERNGDEDYDCFLAVANFDLWRVLVRGCRQWSQRMIRTSRAEAI